MPCGSARDSRKEAGAAAQGPLTSRIPHPEHPACAITDPVASSHACVASRPVSRRSPCVPSSPPRALASCTLGLQPPAATWKRQLGSRPPQQPRCRGHRRRRQPPTPPSRPARQPPTPSPRQPAASRSWAATAAAPRAHSSTRPQRRLRRRRRGGAGSPARWPVQPRRRPGCATRPCSARAMLPCSARRRGGAPALAHCWRRPVSRRCSLPSRDVGCSAPLQPLPLHFRRPVPVGRDGARPTGGSSADYSALRAGLAAPPSCRRPASRAVPAGGVPGPAGGGAGSGSAGGTAARGAAPHAAPQPCRFSDPVSGAGGVVGVGAGQDRCRAGTDG